MLFKALARIPPLSALTKVFHLSSFLFFAAVYFAIYKFIWRFASYPIELEWREGTAWLHAWAQAHGVNIFDHEKIAYANANHGIFDPVIKAALLHAFPFFGPQYILRFFVILFPAASLLAIFSHCRRGCSTPAAFITALGLSSILLITLHDIGHWNTLIGRSDSTAYTLMAIAYLCYSTNNRGIFFRPLRHLSYLAIALVLSTNWRIYPVALVVPLLMEQQNESSLRIQELLKIYLAIIAYTLITCSLFIAIWFHFDATAYYRHFFGFFSGNSPWPPSSAPFRTMIHYVRTPAIAWLVFLSLAPFFVEIWRYFGKQAARWPELLAATAIVASLAVSILAFKMNFQAAGYWYLSPQVIVLLIYYNRRYKIGPGIATLVLALSLCILWRSDNLPLIKWQYEQLAETLPAARRYTNSLILLDRAFGIYSEEAHLFRRTETLPPVDMGDVAEAFAQVNYFGPQFTAVFSEQRRKILSHEPILVFVGSCASSAVKQLAEDEDYCLFLKSPTLWIGGAVYVRRDHIEDVQGVLMTHAKHLE